MSSTAPPSDSIASASGKTKWRRLHQTIYVTFQRPTAAVRKGWKWAGFIVKFSLFHSWHDFLSLFVWTIESKNLGYLVETDSSVCSFIPIHLIHLACPLSDHWLFTCLKVWPFGSRLPWDVFGHFIKTCNNPQIYMLNRWTPVVPCPDPVYWSW